MSNRIMKTFVCDLCGKQFDSRFIATRCMDCWNETQAPAKSFCTNRQWLTIGYIEQWLEPRFKEDEVVKFTGNTQREVRAFIDKYLKRAQRMEREFCLEMCAGDIW